MALPTDLTTATLGNQKQLKQYIYLMVDMLIKSLINLQWFGYLSNADYDRCVHAL